MIPSFLLAWRALVRSDGTAAGWREMYIRAVTGATFAFTVVTVLVCACGFFAQERARFRLSLTVVRPVPAFAVAAGKWLALCAAAAWLLPCGGRFALVHRPERLCDIFCAMRESGIEPKRVRFVRHRQSAPVCLVLLEGRRGGAPGVRFEADLIEFTQDGAETADYRAAYHRGENE